MSPIPPFFAKPPSYPAPPPPARSSSSSNGPEKTESSSSSSSSSPGLILERFFQNVHPPLIFQVCQGSTYDVSLQLAVIRGEAEKIADLLGRGADAFATNSEGENSFHLCAKHDRLNLLQEIIEKTQNLSGFKAALEAGDSDGRTPLHVAVSGSAKPKVVELLLKAGVKPNPQTLYGYTPLHWAARHAHLESAQLLVRAGAEVHPINVNGQTPLDLAIGYAQNQMSLFLIDPTRFEGKILLEEPSGNLEEFYDKAFQKAYTESAKAEQLLYLEKLGTLFLSEHNYLLASFLLNSALAAVISYDFDLPYQRRLIKKLERIEVELCFELTGVRILNQYSGYIEEHRRELASIREEAKSSLQLTDESIQLQSTLSTRLSGLLIKIIKESIAILGDRPTRFSILSLGSMSRKEMSPYSDVEFAFLIENVSSKEYFRKLARLIELKMVNIGETHFKLTKPRRVEGVMVDPISFCPSGFSLDIGGLSPSGKRGVYELIGTPKELSHYVSDEWLNKNDSEIILANSLASSDLLMGEDGLFEEYSLCVKEVLNQSLGSFSLFSTRMRCHEKRALDLLGGHVTEFQPDLSEEKLALGAFNVKKEFYRPFQMILESLSLYFNIASKTTLGRIADLKEGEFISGEGAVNLEKIFHIATCLRFETQFFYEKEEEHITYRKRGRDGDRSYFQVYPSFASEIYQVLFPFHRAAVSFLEGNRESFKDNPFYDEKIGQVEYKAFELNSHSIGEIEKKSIQAAALDPSSRHLEGVGFSKLVSGKPNEAIEHYTQALAHLKRRYHVEEDSLIDQLLRSHARGRGVLLKGYREDLSKKICREMAECLFGLGTAHGILRQSEEAMRYHNKALRIRQILFKGKPHQSIVESLINLGIAHKALGQTLDAIKNFKLALEMKKQLGNNSDPEIVMLFGELAAAHELLGKSEEVAYYKEKGSVASDELVSQRRKENDPIPIEEYLPLAINFQVSGKPQKAIECLESALPLLRSSFENKPHPVIASVFFILAAAYKDLGQLNKVVECWEEALPIQKALHNGKPNGEILAILCNLGESSYHLGQNEKAVDYLEQAIAMHKLLFGEQQNSNLIIPLRIALAGAYASLNQIQQSTQHLQLALIGKLLIRKRDEEFVVILSSLGAVHYKSGKHREAIDYLNQALAAQKELFGDKPNHAIATSLEQLGVCHKALSDTKKAQEYLQQAQAYKPK